MSSLESPVPASWTVRNARDAYLAENGFPLEGYDAKWTEGAFLGIRVPIPNTRRHRWAIMLHDLHHVATGYGTDLAGEGEISAWELRRGVCELGPYVAGLVLTGFVVGMLAAPRRTIAAWRASGGSGRALWGMHVEYTEMLDRDVGELRAMLGVPARGVADGPRARHSRAAIAMAQPR